MATYNGERFIAEQIDSIVNQTYTNWKLIIHDDGSEDGTVSIIKQYQQQFPDKIFLMEDGIVFKNAYKNFFHLLENIDDNFDYLMFSDQDDIWLKAKIEVLCDLLILKEEICCIDTPIIIFSDATVVDKNLCLIADSRVDYMKTNPRMIVFPALLSFQTVATGCALICNKSGFTKILPIPKFDIAHDTWMGFIVSKYGKLFFLNESTMLYRRHNHNVSQAFQFNAWNLFTKMPLSQILKIYRQVENVYCYIGENLSLFTFSRLLLQVLWLRLTWRKNTYSRQAKSYLSKQNYIIEKSILGNYQYK